MHNPALELWRKLLQFWGPEEVTFHLVDDKAKVPVDIAAAKKQTPLLMHMEYQVTLREHDFIVGSKHKLIPLVIGDRKAIKSKDLANDAVSYSGPTCIAIRSAKRSGSLKFHHLRDMSKMHSLPKKMVMIVTVDGATDENLSHTNTINYAIDYFNELNLDAHFLATNAPGRNGVNQIERRISNLIRELSGFIQPHDHFGTHLDHNNTVDEELEHKNFEHAGEILAELWSKLVISNHPVVAEFVREEP